MSGRIPRTPKDWHDTIVEDVGKNPTKQRLRECLELYAGLFDMQEKFHRGLMDELVISLMDVRRLENHLSKLAGGGMVMNRRQLIVAWRLLSRHASAGSIPEDDREALRLLVEDFLITGKQA